jgi:DNA-binding NarL/FixJ family response regulator
LNRPRVLLADDHSSVIERVSALLQPGFEVVGAVANGKELLFESARLLPDVIVLDISMPELSGIEAVHELRSTGSTAKVVFLTVQTGVEFVRACLDEGALGYVIKSRLATDLIPAIQHALSGQSFISSPTSR